MKSTATATTNNYLGRVLNTLGVQAARKMKAKHRAMVSIKDLASALKAFTSKSELMQLTSSVNHLIKMGIVELVLPECVNKSLKEVGLGGKLVTNICSHSPVSQGVNLGTQFYGSNPIPASKMSMAPFSQPRLSPGIVYSGNTRNVRNCCPTGGDCCNRPRQSVGNNVGLNHLSGNNVGLNQMSGNVGLNQMSGNNVGLNHLSGNNVGLNHLSGNNLGFNQLGSCNCRPRLSVG